MTTDSTRRRFLEMSGAVAVASYPGVKEMVAQTVQETSRPKVAALASTYYYLSHAYHIVGRFLDGFVVHDGHGLHKPPFEIASLFIEQVSPGDRSGPRPGWPSITSGFARPSPMPSLLEPANSPSTPFCSSPSMATIPTTRSCKSSIRAGSSFAKCSTSFAPRARRCRCSSTSTFPTAGPKRVRWSPRRRP